MKRYHRLKHLKIQQSSVDSEVKSRQMATYKDEPQPGPEVYSLRAAHAKDTLQKKGSQKMTTVDMRNMKGERGSFLYTKHKRDYEDNGHHEIQNARDSSSLAQRP